MFWLGIAFVIISGCILVKGIYELGYNAGFDDGKNSAQPVLGGWGWRTKMRGDTIICYPRAR